MVFPSFLFFLMRFSPLLLQLLFQHGSTGIGLCLQDLGVSKILTQMPFKCSAYVTLITGGREPQGEGKKLGQTHFHSFYLFSPELRLLSGLLAVRTITVVLQNKRLRALKCQRWDPERCSTEGQVYLLSSESRFDLLPLVEVLQTDLPQS